MKFLYEHHTTRSLLNDWADDKSLILARFFFWKPGSPLQKNLTGLIQSILYHVLSQIPHHAAVIFPQHWSPSEYQAWGDPVPLNMTKAEIFCAFDTLIKRCSIYDDHRLCFFIDGLDEFEETYKSYGDLVNYLQDWVKKSSGDVKICVSSRELPNFVNRLSSDQRIRLQNLTRNDISEFTRQKLNQEIYYQKLLKQHPRKCEKLENQINIKSDGVFLWVALTLKLLCEDFVYEEPLDDLLRKLDSFPPDLEEFFRHILNSIPKGHRRKAYCSLAFAMKSIEIMPYSRPARYTKCVGSSLYSTNSVFNYWLLDKYIDSPRFATRDMKFMSANEIDEALSLGATHVTGRCRGLLELQITDSGKVKDEKDTRDALSRVNRLLIYRATFIHRSVPEFLEDSLKAEASIYLQDFDVMDAILQNLIALVKTITITENKRLTSFFWYHLRDLSVKISKFEPSEMTRCFQSLDDLEEALYLVQSKAWNVSGEIDWTKFMPTPWYYKRQHLPHFLSIVIAASSIGLYEYILWKIERDPKILHSVNSTMLLQASIEAAPATSQSDLGKNHALVERITTYIRSILAKGVNFNARDFSRDDGMSIWASHLT
jgi:hypothetical protein